jgi:capsular polysaccharide biosynthesis protein
MKELYAEYTSIRNHPKNLAEKDVSLFEHEFSKKIHATTIEVLENIDIFYNSLFSFEKSRFYDKYSGATSVKRKAAALMMYSTKCEKIDKGAWISDTRSAGYFHWITDSLTRLIIIEDMLGGRVVLLSSKYKKHTFIQESLELLNIQYRFYDPYKRLRVKDLLVPGITAPTGNYNKEIINKVRDRFLSIDTTVISPNKKIYISRQKATKRKIINEDAVLSLLMSYGFEEHFFEDYNLLQQIELMRQATHIVGLHGAGLTNMLFMPKHSKVLELRNEGDDLNNCYFSLASDLGHDYYYLLNEGNLADAHFADLTIDVERLKEILKQI